jgi:hypothetical protein
MRSDGVQTASRRESVTWKPSEDGDEENQKSRCGPPLPAQSPDPSNRPAAALTVRHIGGTTTCRATSIDAVIIYVLACSIGT